MGQRTCDAAGRGAGGAGIDQEDMVRAVQPFQQAGRLATGLDDLDTPGRLVVGQQVAQQLGDQAPGCIVAAVGIADADHQRA